MSGLGRSQGPEVHEALRELGRRVGRGGGVVSWAVALAGTGVGGVVVAQR